MAASDPKSLVATLKSHQRLSADEAKGEETVTYISDEQEDAGPLCLKLLSQLKGIQMGKVEDKFGWCLQVSEGDREKAAKHEAANGNGKLTVDQTV